LTKVKPSPNGNNAGLHYRGMVNYEGKYKKIDTNNIFLITITIRFLETFAEQK